MPGREHEAVVERLADVAADMGISALSSAEPVAEVEVRHPRLASPPQTSIAAAVRSPRGGAGPRDVEHRVDDLPPPGELVPAGGRRLLPDDPGAAEVRVVARRR